MQLSPVSRKDLPALAEVIRLSVPSLHQLDSAILEDRIFADPDHDISFLLQATEKDKVVGLMLGVARPNPQGKTGYIKMFAVHPEHRGQGIGGTLFSEMERRFRKREVHELHTGNCPAPNFVGGIGVQDTATVSYLMKRGYRPVKTLIQMTANLKNFSATMDESLNADIKIASADTLGVKAVLEFAAAVAPGNAWEIKKSAEQGSLMVLWDKKKVIGFAAAQGLSPDQHGPLILDLDYKETNLQTVLLKSSLNNLKAKGVETILFTQAADVPLFERLAGASLGPVVFDLVKRV